MVRLVFIRLYREGKLERDNVSAHELKALAHQDDVVLCIDSTDPTADDLLGVETVHGLHRLAVEDAVHDFLRRSPAGPFRSVPLSTECTPQIARKIPQCDFFMPGAYANRRTSDIPGLRTKYRPVGTGPQMR
jgi:hypothetical protein